MTLKHCLSMGWLRTKVSYRLKKTEARRLAPHDLKTQRTLLLQDINFILIYLDILSLTIRFLIK